GMLEVRRKALIVGTLRGLGRVGGASDTVETRGCVAGGLVGDHLFVLPLPGSRCRVARAVGYSNGLVRQLVSLVLGAARKPHLGLGDVGVVSDYVDTRGLMAWPWVDDQLVALLPRGWLGRAPGAVRFAELLEKPFVGLPADAGLSRYLAVQASRCGRVPHHRV